MAKWIQVGSLAKRAAAAVLALALTAVISMSAAQSKPQAPTSLRLYIFDCGTIAPMNVTQYDLKPEEVKGPTGFVTPCYLVVHPRGTLMWDVGQIPDSAFPPGGGPVTQSAFTSTRPLLPQLATVGYTPADITYLAMSHYHTDHSANANSFAGSTWIVQEAERTAMFASAAPRLANPTFFNQLKDSKTILLKGEDRDVFGDGSVVIKFTPGHTPGHQALFLKFANTGPVLLAGDLYHYVEERTLDRVPTFDADRDQTRKSRRAMDEFVKQAGAQLWIEHDTAAWEKLKKSPQYYD